jgi:hypothetical protein
MGLVPVLVEKFFVLLIFEFVELVEVLILESVLVCLALSLN